MAGGGAGFNSGYCPLPCADANCNLISADVVGNKSDAAAVGAVTTTESIMAYSKQIVTALVGTGGICNVVIPLGPFGNPTIQDGIDSAATYTVHLVNLNGDVLANCETTPGTYDLVRIRAGTSCTVVSASTTCLTEANGIIAVIVDFTCPACRWTDGDLGYIEFNNITATVCCVVSSFPIMRKYFRLTQEEDIEAAIVVIDEFHDVPAANNVLNAQMNEVIGQKCDAAAAGVATTCDTMVGYMKQLVNAQLVAVADAACNVVAGDIVGNKCDAADYSVDTASSLMEYLKATIGATVIASGTFTTGSTTVPADTSRSEASCWFNGNILMPVAGCAAFQTRTITNFNATGDVFTVDAQEPFTVATGTVAYVVLAARDHVVPATDTCANTMPYHVIGSKADAAAAVDCTGSLIAYAKQGLADLIVIDEFHDVPAANNLLNAQINEVIGNKADCAASGAVTCCDTLVGYTKQLVTEGIARDSAITVIDAFHDIPCQDATCNLVMSDVIGSKADTSSFVINCQDSVISYLKGILPGIIITAGTFTTSSLTVPADTGRAEVSCFFNGNVIMPTAGCAAFQTRTISNFNSTGDVFTLDAQEPFTTLPGTVAYVIFSARDHVVATADAATNTMPYHVIGNKADAAAVAAVSTCESIMAYVKQIVTLNIARDLVVGGLACTAATGAVTCVDTLMEYQKQLVTEGIARDGVVGSLTDAGATGIVTCVDTMMAYIKQIVEAVRPGISSMDFWSIMDACVTITACATDVALSDVVTADIPCGATVTRAYGMMKYSKAVNTNAAANSLITAACITPALQMRVACGTFIDAYLLPACAICLPACGREGGDIWIGNIDVTEEFCTPNATYNFQLCDVEACVASITLKDVQTGIRVYFV